MNRTKLLPDSRISSSLRILQVGFVDTDFAGCQRTRRSTSGGITTLGPHALRHWATTQPTLALSSGEAELSGITKGAAHALGVQPLARDMGLELKLHILSDAVAAIGICKRRGRGRLSQTYGSKRCSKREIVKCQRWLARATQRTY